MIALRLRALLRACGFRIHKGWQATHWSGCELRCIGCGECRTLYCRPWAPFRTGWWETTREGDGSCGCIPPLPERW